MSLAILIVYGLFLSFIMLYSFVQLRLAFVYMEQQRELVTADKKIDQWQGELPVVTVQLPVFNERYVIVRLIDQVAAMDWPLDKLEIQVLDDSDDETVGLAAERVKHWHSKGVDINHVRRSDRKGYKAGALAYGMDHAKGEFVAVFDADFLPPPEMLRKVIPNFTDQEVGMVQTQWGHLNQSSNLLTQLQAFGLEAHFTVEQVGRNSLGHFMNFNGTAGVWRKQCIEEAGGWKADTLTEDLDLSYRAQLKGWKFKYREDVVSPAELPAVMNALKTQQYRWNKGAAECVVKNMPKVIKDRDIGFTTKIHALFHLMGSTVFVCILGTALLSVPVLWIKHLNPELKILFEIAVVFTFALAVLSVFYWAAHRKQIQTWRDSLRFIMLFPVFLSVSMGLSLHNAIAVIEGYMGRRTPFMRTPKLNLKGAETNFKKNNYMRSAITPITILEGLLALYAIGGIVLAFKLDDMGLLPYHMMLAFGFGSVCYYSVVHSLRTS